MAGKPTANFVRYNSTMLASATYYDVFGRVIQTCAKNQAISEGYDRFTNQYKELTSNILKAEHKNFVYAAPYLTLNELTEYTYDATGRPMTYAYTYNGAGPVRKIAYTYNTLGQVKSKQVKDDANLMQTMDYAYNIRGWLTKINDPATVSSTGDLFGMELFYNNTDGSLPNNALFNGNISAIKWQTVQPTGISTPVTSGQKAYKYSYDKLNRILTGDYSEMVNSTWDNTTKKYSETILNITSGKTYDLNGNIQGIMRNGLQLPTNAIGPIDLLKYTYDGNKLIAVEDNITTDNGGDFVDGNRYARTAEYAYDANGNLTKDLNKGIVSITYNYLNLPLSITKSVGNRVEYTYDAAGTKLSQLYYLNGTLTKTTNFYTNFVYENNAPAWVNYDEGRILLNSNGSSSINEAYLKDHLGNIRVAYYWAGSLKTQQVNSYYPFGLNIKGLSLNGSATYKKNEYLYNGKMMQDEMGLNLLDYGARFYDAVLGRWHSVDPLAEKYESISPFAYCALNPIKFVDKDGCEIWLSYVHKVDGQTVSVQYKNGALFNTDGSKYEGKNSYFTRTAVQLNQLQYVGEENTNIITTLELSDNKHTITNFDPAYPDAKGNHNRSVNILDDGIIKGITESGNTVTKYDPEATKNVNGEKRNPKVGLIHELKHAFDRDQGTFRRGKTENGIKNSEVDAVNTENLTRKNTGDPKRTSYGRKQIPKEELK